MRALAFPWMQGHDVERARALADPELRRALERVVKGRLPAAEVDDVVQDTLAEALASRSAPAEKEALRRWVFGIARHKVADYFRKRREVPEEDLEAPAASAPHGARDLVEWVEKVVPQSERSKQTLEWMAREGEGEKLETIAQEAKVPAPRVRQRVSRLRRALREHWKAELAIALAITVAVGLVVWLSRGKRAEDVVVDRADAAVPAPDARQEKADDLRRAAFEACRSKEYRRCLDRFDEARELDPAGDRDEAVIRARRDAEEALKPAPAPSATISATPAPSSVAPVPSPSIAPQRPPVQTTPQSTGTPPSTPPPPPPPASAVPRAPKTATTPLSTGSL